MAVNARLWCNAFLHYTIFIVKYVSFFRFFVGYRIASPCRLCYNGSWPNPACAMQEAAEKFNRIIGASDGGLTPGQRVKGKQVRFLYDLVTVIGEFRELCETRSLALALGRLLFG